MVRGHKAEAARGDLTKNARKGERGRDTSVVVEVVLAS